MNKITKENLSKYYDLATIPSSNPKDFDEFERYLFGKNWNMEIYNFLDSVYKKPNGKELFINFVLSGKYKTESKVQPKSEAYGKPKQGVQTNYPKEIAQQTISPTTLKTITNNGDFITIVKMIASQSVGKVELICKPFNYVKDDNPALKGTKFDKLVNIKFILDFRNLTYNKITDGKDDISKSENRQELISDFSDLIKASDKNNYSSIILYKNSSNIKSEAYIKSKITENAAKNNFTFEDDDETINVYLKNVSPTTPIFTINKSDISLEKYQNVQELMTVINKIFSDIDTSTLTKDDFSQKLSGGGSNSKTIMTLQKRFRNLRDALKYAKTKSINVGKVQQESLSEMIRRVIKEESATELSPGEVFVSFGSHRARDYATRALGELPNPLYSFTSGTHLYKVNQDQLAKLSGSKRIVMKQYKKLPKGEWLNSWKR